MRVFRAASILTSTGHILKIATYNLNGVKGRLKVFLRGVEEASPDIVCLQKLKAPDTSFLRKNSGPGTARSGRDENFGTASPFWARAGSHFSLAGVFPVIPTIHIADTSRLLSTDWRVVAFMYRNAIPLPARRLMPASINMFGDGSIRATTPLSG